MPYIQNATSYIIEVFFNIALYLVLLRFWMQWARANFRNELGQFIIKVSNPIIVPIRRLIPSIGKIDTATVILAIIVALLKILALTLVFGNINNVSALKLLTVAVAMVLDSSIYVFIGAIFIGIIASWIRPQGHHPILSIAYSISEPLLAPARRLLPPMGGIDFSAMLVLVCLRVLQMLLIAPIYALNI